MNPRSIPLARLVIFVVLLTALGACGLPRSGPNKNEILKIEADETSTTEIVVVDEFVTVATAPPPATGFPRSLINAGPAAPDRIRPGDTLSFQVYENIEDGVLTRGRAGTAELTSIQVDESGFIFIPYAGRIRAAGNTPEALRRAITSKLGDLTPEPQVLVQRNTGDDATVSILGDGIAAQGVYPIRRSSRRLMEMLATAGGITAPSEVARIIVLRNHLKGEIWFEDVYDHPELDIAMRAGDRILVQRDPRTFTALGATGTQANVPFAMRRLSALEALGQVGGLDPNVADPTGLFIVRKESAAAAARVLRRNDVAHDKSIIYVLDLTKPTGIPLARDFVMRDGDTLYVTEALYVQWNKTLRALTGTVGTVRTVDGL